MLKNSILVLIFIGLIRISSYAQLHESFSDGNFTTNPTWIGDTSYWKIVGQQLNSNGPPTSSSAQLCTRNNLSQNVVWEFYVNLKFATSSVNYTDIFLISDSANLMGLNSGIFVRIGNTNDEISLYRKDTGAITKLIDGIDGRLASTSSNSFKIRVSRDLNNLFELYDDASGTGNNFVLEGTVHENNYPSKFWSFLPYFGMAIHYSSSNLQKFFFDDFVIQTITPDTTSPILDSILVLDSIHCRLQYNEPLDSMMAINCSNYLLNKKISPIISTLNSNNRTQITLSFSVPFEPNTLQFLEVRNQKDLIGNQRWLDTANFKFRVVQNGDLVINEIFADPSPSIGLPNYEFIELWNTSSDEINLQGFSITDGSSTAILPNYILQPDSFVVVSTTSSSNIYATYGNSVVVSNFPSLNNDADQLKLLRIDGSVIDEVNYQTSWYNNPLKSEGGWTLELINPRLRCKGKYNWSASENQKLGGTPGMPNSIYNAVADTISPRLISFQIFNDSSALLIFNSTMDSTSVSTIATTSTQFIEHLSILNKSADSILIEFSPLLNKASYGFNFSDSKNCGGKKMIPFSFQGVYDKVFKSRFNGVLITELLINSIGNSYWPGCQYIELSNQCGYSINLQSMKITDGNSMAVLPNYILKNDSHIVLVSALKLPIFIALKIPVIGINSFPYLNQESDKLWLLDSNSTIVHEIHYEMEAFPNNPKLKGGWSLEMVDEKLPCITQNNWQFSIDSKGGTPSAINSVQANLINTLPLKLIRAYTLADTSVVFLFNKSIDINSLDSAIFQFTNASVGAIVIDYHQQHLNEIHLILKSSTWGQGFIYSMNIRGLSDCSGHLIQPSTIYFGLPSIPNENDISINEIVFDAYSNGSEFIELYNNTDKIFDLHELSITCFDKEGLLHATLDASDIPWQFLPKTYLVICNNKSALEKDYSHRKDDNIIQTLNWKSLDDDSGILILQYINSTIAIDSAIYSAKWHHPFINNTEGISLERISMDRSGTSALNWGSASSNFDYGTPGLENSKYNSSIAPDVWVHFNKDYFTPDNDGVDDEISFTIALPTGSQAINISIYDLAGRLVNTLAKNDIGGTKNYYRWDGRMMEGELANTGHYIFLISIIDGQGNSHSNKHVVDLLMK